MQRRDFLKRTAALSAAALVGQVAKSTMASDTADHIDTSNTAAGGDFARSLFRADKPTAGGFYTPSRSPLKPTAFQKLPPGSIQPRGWLQHQLALQVDGLNGRMSEISDYLDYDTNGWVDPAKNAWEELPYWLRGFGDLGYVTGDARVLALTRKWINGILATQQPDGFFGPTRLRTSLEGGPDFWPSMPLLDALRSFQEYSNDDRIVPFLTRFFQFQSKQPDAVFHRSWASFRWGDTIDSIYWLYNRTGDGWLLDLVHRIHAQSADYTNGLPTPHNVNLAQGFREPAEYALLASNPRFLAATYRNYNQIMRRYGQFPGGAFAGDEICRPGFGDPRQGFETCGIVEFMHSFEMLTRYTGDPVWADRCEEITFNNMPAAFDPQQKGTHYITCANCNELDNKAKSRQVFANDWAMQAYMPGVHNYRCCPHNYGMGWPYYAEELWLATPDGGLCASLYAASVVSAKVGGGGGGAGTTMKITADTNYPLSDTVEMTLSSPQRIAFPLYLRIPAWCENASVVVNGAPVTGRPTASSYFIIQRTWRDGDRISLRLPMTTFVHTWPRNHDAVSVRRGPLHYSLAFDEQWKQINNNAQWPEYTVASSSPWNYGLVLDDVNPASSFEATAHGDPAAPNPWTPQDAPVQLRAAAKRVPPWTAGPEGVVEPLMPNPVKSDQPTETLTLIPMGAARLRITTFPAIDTASETHPWG